MKKITSKPWFVSTRTRMGITTILLLCGIGMAVQAQVLVADSIKIDSTTAVKLINSKTLNTANQPLFILNEKRISADSAQYINPESIESIEVLKGEKTKPYGESGKNGVIIIKLKDETKFRSFNKKP